jgi:hypothetical protein
VVPRRAPRNDVGNDVGNLADAIVLLRRADVERLQVHELARRLERCQERARDVLDVDERAPGRAVAHDQDVARGEGETGQVVDDEVAAQPRRDAVGRGTAEERGAERVPRQQRDVLLGEQLRLAIGRDGVPGSVLVEELVAGRAIEAARRREDEALDSGGLRRPRDVHGRVVVDVERRLGPVVAQRVVRDRSEVHDRVEAREVVDRDVADVAPQRGDRLRLVAEAAARVQAGVEPDHLVPRRLEERDEDGADVAVVTGDENSHAPLPPDSPGSTVLPELLE